MKVFYFLMYLFIFLKFIVYLLRRSEHWLPGSSNIAHSGNTFKSLFGKTESDPTVVMRHVKGNVSYQGLAARRAANFKVTPTFLSEGKPEGCMATVKWLVALTVAPWHKSQLLITSTS